LLNKLKAVVICIAIVLPAGCGMKNITIDTELTDRRIINEVKLSKGVLHFRYSNGNYPEFMLVDEAGSYGSPYAKNKGRALPYSVDVGLLHNVLRLEPDSWDIPEGYIGSHYRDGFKNIEVYINIYNNYEIASSYLLYYEFTENDNKSYIRIYTQYYKLPIADELYTYGEDNSKIGRLTFPIEYNTDSLNRICISTRFMKKSTGYEIRTSGVSQEDFINLLLSIIEN
jgi:hypothetical protein